MGFKFCDDIDCPLGTWEPPLCGGCPNSAENGLPLALGCELPPAGPKGDVAALLDVGRPEKMFRVALIGASPDELAEKGLVD